MIFEKSTHPRAKSAVLYISRHTNNVGLHYDVTRVFPQGFRIQPGLRIPEPAARFDRPLQPLDAFDLLGMHLVPQVTAVFVKEQIEKSAMNGESGE